MTPREFRVRDQVSRLSHGFGSTPVGGHESCSQRVLPIGDTSDMSLL